MKTARQLFHPVACHPLRIQKLFLAVLLTVCGAGQVCGQTTTTPKKTGKPTPTVAPQAVATSSVNMVASVHPLATQAGLNAMEQGGNAIDAAIATALTLGVVDSYNSGIGGGCFVLIRTADGKITAIDGREMAPAAAHADLFREAEKKQKNASTTGALASGVPGALAAYHQAVTRHGRLKFSKLISPAADIAENGFAISKTYEKKLTSVQSTLNRFPAAAEIFLKPGNDQKTRVPYREGETLIQKDLANTYRMIAAKGPSWFYNGPFATKTAQWMAANGGIMTAADFANYRTVDRQPVRSTYRQYEVLGFPPPSSGGVHVGQILNILENYDLAKLHQQNPATMFHVVGEAMKFAFADRAEWLGDPDFVDVPKGLIDQSYADAIAKKIVFDKASQAKFGKPPGFDSRFFERHTTHIAAADSEGNWVAITSTVNTTFGSKVVVDGLGVVMNNQMDDFVAVPGRANAFGLVGGKRNAVAAKKRPLSSMSPTIVLKDGQPVLTVGAAGGPKIITEVVNTMIHHLDLGKPVDAAVKHPRLHHQWAPDVLMIENGFAENIVAELKSRGHKIRRISGAGICQAISYDPVTKKFRGAADPRTTGSAAGAVKVLK